jgi:peptidyl-prolyl cis-trans isomerase C
VRSFNAEKTNVSITKAQTETFVMNELVNRITFAQAIRKAGYSISDAAIKNELNELYDQAGGKEKVAEYLAQNYGPEADLELFELWIRETSPQTVIEQNILERATVRHILIRSSDGATPEEREAARQKALAIRAKISDKNSFIEQVKAETNDTNTRDKEGLRGTTIRGSDSPGTSAEFENAVFTQPLNTVSEPVPSSLGWHLVWVDSREGAVPLSMSGYAQQLRDQASIRLYLHVSNQ